ncbi:MAG: Ldh family oxidoreductase [Chloroflexota bacterium]
MPVFKAERLREVGEAILEAAGATPATARQVAASLVESNLLGHDSHGVILIPQYVKQMKAGRIDASATPSILRETPATAVLDGCWAFGVVSVGHAVELAMAKARQTGLGAVGVVRCNHSGRLGQYTSRIAAAGMVGIVLVRGVNKPGVMVPFGGSQPLFGTNPYSFAIPAGELAPVVVDFATSGVAGGKVKVARDKGDALAPGLIVDKHGQPSTNPADFFDGGALLPMGEHKGYSLALVAELLAGQLIGTEVYEEGRNTQGTLVLAMNVDAFRPLPEFQRAADERLRQVKAVPSAPGVSEVLIPGERSRKTKQAREQSGIELPGETWQSLVRAAQELGMAQPCAE